jgi:type II secretory pathway component PulF
MMTFSYQARDASGKIITGVQDALNEDNAVTSLMSRGLMVLSLQQKSPSAAPARKTGQ